MDYHAWERYNEDEFFTRFLRISPTLSYASDQRNVKKLEFQRALLEARDAKSITDDQLLQIYASFNEAEKSQQRYLDDLRGQFASIIANTKKQQDEDSIKSIDKHMLYLSSLQLQNL